MPMMGGPTKCCSACATQNLCAIGRSCCLECHFAYEEEYAMPYLPRELQLKLRDEHRTLIAKGLPKDAVARHAEREMKWFRRYVPPDIVAIIDQDHQQFEDGVLKSRAENMRA